MRAEEAQYWDNQFSQVKDNIHKRKEIVRRLLELDLIEKNVLEIGIGLGTAFAAIHVVLMNHINYFGTDVSKEAVDFNQEQWGTKVVQADIVNIPIPSQKMDMIVCLDSLEHVHPFDREHGYKEIDRILKNQGSIVVNIPLEETLHNLDFDHGFSTKDLIELMESTRTELLKYEKYQVVMGNGDIRKYAWVVLERSEA